MEMTCPHCGLSGNVKEENIGKSLKCPKCRKSIPVQEKVEENTEPPGIPAMEMAESLPSPAVKTSTCSGCSKEFQQDELIDFEGELICAACKPAFLQKLKEGATTRESSGVEAGIAGHFSLQIGEVVSESWQKVKGTKGSALGAIILMYITAFLLMGAGGVLTGMMGIDENNIGLLIGTQLLIQLIYMVVIWVFSAGVVMIGVRRAADQPFSFSMLFDGFSKTGKIVTAMLLQTALISLGFILLIIPGIYLAVGYGLTLPLIMEKGLGPWEALEASRKAIHHCWFQIFGLYLLMTLIFMISCIPLGIGMIWTAPMALIMIGVVYRIIFGVDEK